MGIYNLIVLPHCCSCHCYRQKHRCIPASEKIQWQTYAPFSTLMERIFWNPLSMMFWHSSMNSQRLPWKFSSSQTVILHCPICSIICCCVFMVAVVTSLPTSRTTRNTSSYSPRLWGDQKKFTDSWCEPWFLDKEYLCNYSSRVSSQSFEWFFIYV